MSTAGPIQSTSTWDAKLGVLGLARRALGRASDFARPATLVTSRAGNGGGEYSLKFHVSHETTAKIWGHRWTPVSHPQHYGPLREVHPLAWSVSRGKAPAEVLLDWMVEHAPAEFAEVADAIIRGQPVGRPWWMKPEIELNWQIR